MFVLVVEATLKEGAEAKFLEVIRHDAEHSEADEPGCIRFDVLKDAEVPNKYYFYEVYVDADAVEAHRAAPHFKPFEQERPNLFESIVVHRTVSVVPGETAFIR